MNPILGWDVIENPPFIKAANFTKANKRGVDLIVIHTMETAEKLGTARNVGKYFAQGPGASTHYGIDSAEVIQYVWDSYVAWGCRNANHNGIHIEHAGRAAQTEKDWDDDFSVKELTISAQIGVYLCKKLNMYPQRAKFKSSSDPTVLTRGFCGHADVPRHGSHWDPGKSFPWDDYLFLIKKFQPLYEKYLLTKQTN